MKKTLLAGLATGFLMMGMAGAANAAGVYWIDWQSTNAGTLNDGSHSANVLMTGLSRSLVNGNGYYKNYPTTYNNLNPSDLIQISGTGNINITFDTPVLDPYVAMVSVGQGGLPVSYSFDTPFTVISSGWNQWGYTGYSTSADNKTIYGKEYNGILKFNGIYTSLSFDIGPNENWHGFNIGVADVHPTPEPATLLLLGSGLAGLLGARRKKKVQA